VLSTAFVWDDDSRLRAQSDARGNTTVTRLDDLGRDVATDEPDCTEPDRTCDVHDNLVREVDANGTAVE
jgi:hypothetical protein